MKEVKAKLNLGLVCINKTCLTLNVTRKVSDQIFQIRYFVENILTTLPLLIQKKAGSAEA